MVVRGLLDLMELTAVRAHMDIMGREEALEALVPPVEMAIRDFPVHLGKAARITR